MPQFQYLPLKQLEQNFIALELATAKDYGIKDEDDFAEKLQIKACKNTMLV